MFIVQHPNRRARSALTIRSTTLASAHPRDSYRANLVKKQGSVVREATERTCVHFRLAVPKIKHGRPGGVHQSTRPRQAEAPANPIPLGDRHGPRDASIDATGLAHWLRT